MNSAWIKHAISEINADYQRSADTHLIRLALPEFPGIQLYLKDESTHPTGSLKHRLARSLFLYGLCNGWIKEGTTIIESSSGFDRRLRSLLRPSVRPAVYRRDAFLYGKT